MTVPQLPAMTGMELMCTKEFLGLSTGFLAHHLVISDRRIVRMEAGQETIPQVIVTFLDDVYEETAELVFQMTAEYRRKVKATDGDSVTLLTYRSDASYYSAGGTYPARWHRHLCARVAAAVPGLILAQV